MSTLGHNHCFICLSNVGLKPEKNSFCADLTLKNKICDQFHKCLSTFINLADFKNVYNNKRQLQNNLCCDDCFVSVKKFCEIFESFQCLQMELLQMLEKFSSRMKRKMKANAPTQFQKEFIWKVYQKTNGELSERNTPEKINRTTTTIDDIKTLGASIIPSCFIDEIKCEDDDDDDFNAVSDCDEFPLLLDTDSEKCDIQVEDPLEEDEDTVVGKVLEQEPESFREVSTSRKKGHPTEGICDERQIKTSKRRTFKIRITIPNDCKIDKDYGQRTINGRQRYDCLMCAKKFFERKLHLAHLRRHAHERIYHCRVCWMEFKSLELLTRHQARIHWVTTIDEESDIGSHEKVHLNNTEKPFKCDLCPGRYKLKEYLRNHKRRAHNAKFKEWRNSRAKDKICEVCGKGFAANYKLLVHKALVHGEENNIDVTKIRNYPKKKNFKCQYENCERAFDSRTLLQDHIATHTRQKNFKCDHCGNLYMQQCTLRQHLKLKHSERNSHNFPTNINFKCNYENCGRAFSSRSALTDHLASHTGERNHQCDHCGNAYAQLANLRKHVKRHHSENITATATTQQGERTQRRRK